MSSIFLLHKPSEEVFPPVFQDVMDGDRWSEVKKTSFQGKPPWQRHLQSFNKLLLYFISLILSNLQFLGLSHIICFIGLQYLISYDDLTLIDYIFDL